MVAPTGDVSSETFDVIIVGAGISGINHGYRLQERNPDINFTILEGRHEIGGTWSLFKYPGIRSDSDLYTFGFAWNPWDSKKCIAEAVDIRNYVEKSAQKYGIDKKIRFQHKVIAANYSSTDRQWTFNVTVDGKQQKTFKSHFMLLCSGYYDYSKPLKAAIPGIDNFEGTVIHPQFWPEDLDYTDKNVVVIGSGATAVTLLPSMAKTASHVTMLQRSPGYIMTISTEDWIERSIRKILWWAPGFQHRLFRLKWIAASMLITGLSKWFPQVARRLVTYWMDTDLPKTTSREKHFSPAYTPWQQRMCLVPDKDFFLSLHSGRTSVETDTIETVTTDTIRLTSGKELHPDIIVTATGLQLLFAGGIEVSIDEKNFDVGSKFIWKGMMIEDLPNAAFSIGYVDASWTLGADATAQLVCRLLTRMKKEGVDEIKPRPTEKEKSSMKTHPILRLTSTYVTKSAHLMPKSGDRGQWVPRSYYAKDIMNAWYGDIRTGLDWSKA